VVSTNSSLGTPPLLEQRLLLCVLKRDVMGLGADGFPPEVVEVFRRPALKTERVAFVKLSFRRKLVKRRTMHGKDRLRLSTF